MLSFADNAGQALTIVFALLLGLLICFAQRKTFEISNRRAITIYVWHTLFSVFYMYYSMNNTADATLYYLTSLNYVDGFDFGTHGIYFFTSFFSAVLGMSYGGVNLAFNILGFVGLLAFASALQSVVALKSLLVRRLSLIVIFMPTFSFWSSAIGKDSISFMAAGLATWAAVGFNKRYPAMFLAILAMLFVRPHMAGVMLGSLMLALVFAWRANIVKKVFLMSIALPATVTGVIFGLAYAGLEDASNLSDVGDYFENRQNQNLEGGSSLNIASMSLPMRLFTYLFRPLFFDVSGIFGLIVSMENLIFIWLFGWFAIRLSTGKSTLDFFPRFFLMIFAIFSLFVLANTTANLGIAIRQKMMFMPMFLVLIFSYIGRPRQQQTGVS